MATDTSKVTWIAATEDAVGLAKNANETQRQIADLEDVRASLSRLVDEFRRLSGGATVVREWGWEGRSPSPDLARDLNEAVETLGSRPLGRLIVALERFRTEVASDLIDRSGAQVSERIGHVSELLALSGTLAEVEGVAELSQRLQTVVGELARMQRAVPTKQFAVLLKHAEATLRELEDSLRPNSVRQFLSAVARGGAPIELLSKDVTEWLNSHNALNSFKIVAGSPGEGTDV